MAETMSLVDDLLAGHPAAALNPVDVLVGASIPRFLTEFGKAVADTQMALDRNSIEQAKALAGTTVGDREASGRSLIELGFRPSFYEFSEVKLTLTLNVRMVTFRGLKASANLRIGSNTGETDGASGAATTTPAATTTTPAATTPAPEAASTTPAATDTGKSAGLFGFAISASLDRHVDYSITGDSTISATLRPVPVPAAFEAWLGGQRSGASP